MTWECRCCHHHPWLTRHTLSVPPPFPPPPLALARREGHSKLFMMPLSAKKRAQNQVQGTPILSVLQRLSQEAKVGWQLGGRGRGGEGGGRWGVRVVKWMRHARGLLPGLCILCCRAQAQGLTSRRGLHEQVACAFVHPHGAGGGDARG